MQKTNSSLIKLYAFVILSSLALAPVAQNTFSMDEAIQYALENNSNIRLELLNVTDADGQILEFKSIGIPKLTGTVDYNYFLDLPTQILPDFLSPAVYSILFNEGVLETGDIPVAGGTPVKFGTDHNLVANVELRTMLFDGTFFQGLKAQRMYKNFLTESVDQQNYAVKSGVTKAYLAVLIAQKNKDLLETNIRNLEKLFTETKAIYKSGFAEQLDVDRLELSLENLLAQYTNIDRLIVISKNLLKFEMGFPMADEIVLSQNFENLVDLALIENFDVQEEIEYTNRPEYRTLQMAEELNRINQKVIKSGYLPTLTGFASYSRILQRNELFDSNDGAWFPSTLVGLTLNVPMFDGLEKKAKLQRSKVDLEKNLIQQNEFQRAMTLEVENARVQYQNALLTLEIRDKSRQLADKIYNTTQIKYKEGVGSSSELTQAESDLYSAQANYVASKYDLIVAKTNLEIALGKL